MKQLPKHIEVIDCYDFNELMSKAPFFTDIYSVEVGNYFFYKYKSYLNMIITNKIKK